MKVLDELISILDFEAEVREIRQGVFYTGVLTKKCGLAATLPLDALGQEPPLVKEPGLLLEKDPRDLACLAYSPRILEAAVGMATINSMLDVDEEACVELNAAGLIKEKGRNRRVAIVGHFPFIPGIREVAAEVWVVEKNPREGDVDEAEAKRVIPRADVVAITGTSLINHTLDYLLELCDSRAYVILLGGTSPLVPLLFDHGIDAVSGVTVPDPEMALKCISQGANFRQIRGVKLLTMMK